MNPALNTVDPNYQQARSNMIEGQLRPNGIKDERILSAMETLPRERFMAQQFSGIACIDEEIALSQNRGMLRPLVLARLIQGASIGVDDHVLNIGSMSGYSSAVLAKICKDVVALEDESSMSADAASTLALLGFTNVECVTGPLEDGWRGRAPYHVIVINGSIEFLPESLTDQLTEGGRLLTVFRHYGPGQAAHTGEIRLYQKIHGSVSHRVLADASASLLQGFSRIKTFKF